MSDALAIEAKWWETLGSTLSAQPDSVVRRMDFALASAFHHGTRAIRTHLDGTNSPDPNIRATVYAAFSVCRRKWSARGMQVQGVANLYLPLWRNKALAEQHVAEAIQHEGVLLGAYCGNVAETPEHETLEALDALFRY
jgi:cytosine deaminase